MTTRPSMQIASGTHTGDGAQKVLTLGFNPKYFKLDNVTDRITDEKHSGMGVTETLNSAAAGTRTLDTGTKVSFATKNKVIIAATANVSAKVYHWIAIG